MILGFGTASLYKTKIPPVSNEAIQHYLTLGCNALELAFFVDSDLERFEDIDKTLLDRFEFVSMHVPAIGFGYALNGKTRDRLTKVKRIFEMYPFKAAVIHPDTMIDWEVLNEFDLPFAFENSDQRWGNWMTVQEVADIFSHGDYRFVLDMRKARRVDPTLSNAMDLYNAFRDRILHIHISGTKGVASPLNNSDEDNVITKIPDKKLPIIIESVFKQPDEAAVEYEYVKSLLR